MSTPDQLRTALRRIADSQTPAAPDPAASARRRAGRIRTRRIAGTAVIGAAAVALVVPVGVALFPGSRQQDANVATTTTTTKQAGEPATKPATQADKGSDGVLETSFDLDKLPRGEAPRVPWYSDGVIHDGDQQIPFRGDFKYINNLQKVSDGYVVLADYEGPATGDAELFLVRPNGQRTSLDREPGGLIFDPAVSDDGNLIAWSRFSGQIHEGTGLDSKLNVYDVNAGRVTHSKEFSGGEEVLFEARAFLGSKVVVNRSTNAATKPVKIWDPQRGTLTDWIDSFSLAGVTTDGSLAAVSTGDSRGEGCFAVLRLPSRQRAWRSCDFDHNDVFFSPGNRYVVSSNTDANRDVLEDEIRNGKEPPKLKVRSSLKVFAAGTGEPVLRVNDRATYQIAWESDDTFLFDADAGSEESRRQALVRCTTTGACELATEPKPTTVWTAPYAFAVRR